MPQHARRRLVFALAGLPFAPAARSATPPSLDFSEREDVRSFCAELALAHGLDESAMLERFRDVQLLPKVIALIRPAKSPAVRSWSAYRSRFIEARRIAAGRRFLDDYRNDFERAEQRFGVPRQIVAAILGVETIFGQNTGTFQTLSALATLAFAWPPRAELFRRELGELFLLARDQGRDVRDYRGSYAGALGIPQFLPSSWRRYAVDFDGDTRADLIDSPTDALGSVAHFLHQHGWESGQPIAQAARVTGEPSELVASGIEPRLSREDLARHGVTPQAADAPDLPATLVDLVTPGRPTEYWLGYRNFYVITRYNKSSFYAMAVTELAHALS